MHTGFTIEAPSTLDDALDLLATDDDTVRPVGGGSGLTLLMKYGFFEPTTLVSLRRIPELASVDVTSAGELRLGALCTLRDLERHPAVAERAPLMQAALHRLATVRLRNVAQLGGAIAHGHPQMDLPPVLIALGAQIRVQSRRGERWIDAGELFHGYYETAIESDELLTEVVLPAAASGRGVYRKLTARTQDDWPMLGIAVAAPATGNGDGPRIVLGALTDRPVRLHAAEESITGLETVTSDRLRDIAHDAADGVDCHDSPIASAAYQRHLLRVELHRALHETLLDGATGEAEDH